MNSNVILLIIQFALIPLSMFVIKQWIKGEFSKELEFYKNEYKKNLQDYNLYSGKRNEILQNCYVKAVKYISSFPTLEGRPNFPKFEYLDIHQTVYAFEEDCSIDATEAEQIRQTFRDWKFEHIEIQYLLKRIALNRHNFEYYMMENEVYLKNSLEGKFKELKTMIHKFNNFNESELQSRDRYRLQADNFTNKKELYDQILRKLEDIKVDIKQEIGLIN